MGKQPTSHRCAASPVSIREVTPADVAAVEALAPTLTTGMAAWIPEVKARCSTRGWLVGSVERGNDDTNGAFVAEAQGHVVGFVSVSRTTRWYGAAEGNIGELVVHPDWQGAGLGAMLLQQAEQWCVTNGLDRVVLQTGASNHPAITFYEGRGFSPEEVTLSKALTT